MFRSASPPILDMQEVPTIDPDRSDIEFARRRRALQNDTSSYSRDEGEDSEDDAEKEVPATHTQNLVKLLCSDTLRDLSRVEADQSPKMRLRPRLKIVETRNCLVLL